MAQAKKTPARIWAIWAFTLALLAGLVLTTCLEYDRIQQEQDRMGYIASSIGSETYEILLSQMSKTQVLEAYLMQTGGVYEDFGDLSGILLRESFVRNVLFAPDGIVDGVFPLEGNEAVIGLNMYEDGAGNKEARAECKRTDPTYLPVWSGKCTDQNSLSRHQRVTARNRSRL